MRIEDLTQPPQHEVNAESFMADLDYLNRELSGVSFFVIGSTKLDDESYNQHAEEFRIIGDRELEQGFRAMAREAEIDSSHLFSVTITVVGETISAKEAESKIGIIAQMHNGARADTEEIQFINQKIPELLKKRGSSKRIRYLRYEFHS